MNYSFAHKFSHYIAPTFHGMTLGQWLAILSDDERRINWPYFYRLIPTTFKCCANSLLTRIEKSKYQTQYRDVKIKPPIFILGHWRSGTTFLQNILAKDERFAYPTLYQVTNPNTFLISEETLITRFFSLFVPGNRLFDNVPFGLKAPHEDEFIAWHSSGLTPCMSWNFPNAAAFFDRYLSFKNCTPDEKKAWRENLVLFLKKLTLKHNKPIVLKSPTHTARINLLLDIFPDARFIHIYRNPYRVYQSTQKLHEFVFSISTFQKIDPTLIHTRILNQYKEMYDIYFKEKLILSNNQLAEIKFEDFEREPLKIIESIYSKLNLPDFSTTKQNIISYLSTLTNHKKNTYPELDLSLKNEIYMSWKRNFQIWGYER
ncbi:MAG: sulfotransferase [Calditrichaceae bacterium]|nr:sulfotransferase [Calditrichaceae bacterium]